MDMPANQTIVYPAIPRPLTTVRWPLVPRAGSGASTPPPTGVPADDLDVWSGYGPPPDPPPPGYEEHDTYIDLATGDVYVLNP